ncbi:MAG TPA: hypothetical protein VHR45_06500 [Thermoanaerobaculia bacterium]|nr:hypothetical protein [Thermoanaerobaculia bacterium]
MLNELLVVERGARQAGVEMAERHPDVKDVRRIPTLLVRLDALGNVASLRSVPFEVTPWSLRDGQHNSFPFVQPKLPLWAIPNEDERRFHALDRKAGGRRAALLSLAADVGLDAKAVENWPGAGLLTRLRERRPQLITLENTDAAVVPATIDRFLLACDPVKGGDPQRLLRAVADQLVAQLRQTAESAWIEVAVSLLLGRRNKGVWQCSGALLFEAEGVQALAITDLQMILRVSAALRHSETIGAGTGATGVCGLSGVNGRLVSGSFPQPNLPVLGQTYLFAKNAEIKANDRYHRFSAEAMPVGQITAIRLAAALEALTSDDRDGVTWRAIPGEGKKQSDLLLAFVEGIPDAPAAGPFVDDDAEDEFSSEATDAPTQRGSDSIAVFEKRTERLIEAVRAKVQADFRTTRVPVHLAVFRKVDQANRKVVYSGTVTVAELYSAATGWVAGERNVPPWLILPVFFKGERKPRSVAPLHVAPLGVIRFSRQRFVRRGLERQEVLGLPAAEALGLFIEPVDAQRSPAMRRALRILRMVLARRAALVSGTAHEFRRGDSAKKYERGDSAKKFDRCEALRTVTLLGVLLHKLGRTKEGYMSAMAFKLGQLLAAADMVHAGYCADVRGGNLPPSLLGNQVFTMAQTAPTKALATLCRRWKPYDGWAKKAARDRGRVDTLLASGKKDDERRGWAIKRALRHARDMGDLAGELSASLAGCKVDDTFRAELLLGYIAGLPRAQTDDLRESAELMKSAGQED